MSSSFEMDARTEVKKKDGMEGGKTWKNSAAKNYFVAAVGEFVGTLLFLFFSFAGVQAVKLAFNPLKTEQSNPKSSPPTPEVVLYASIVFGASLAANVWIFYRVSGGIFNPAVVLGVVLLGGMSIAKGVVLFFSQILGGIAAAALVDAIFPGTISFGCELGAGTTTVQGLFLEAFLTFEVTLTIYMLAFEKHRATYLAPIGIGLSLFIAELAGTLFTGGAANPIRAFAPAVVNRNFPGYHWIYWVGPGLGAIAASGFYKMLLVLEYRRANPDQDHDGIERYAFAIGDRADRRRKLREQKGGSTSENRDNIV